MKKIVVGNYITVIEAKNRVNELLAKGFPADSLSVIADRDAAEILSNTGIKVERAFDYVTDIPDETLWEKIKSFLGFGADKENEINIAEYANSIRAGHQLVLVDEERVPTRLKGAWNVAQATTTATAARPVARSAAPPATENGTIRLEEERMNVDKRAVQSGEAIVRKRVVTENETVQVPVKHEEVIIERMPVADRPDTNPDFKDETITIPVMEEKVEVTKRPVVTEEIKIRKRDIEDTESVSATLRKEKLDVEKSGKAVIANAHKG